MSSSMGDSLRRFNETLHSRRREVFLGTITAVRGSIQEGSPVTGAPGQPVDEGHLIGSWQETLEEEWVGLVATPAEYAEAVEEGQQPPYTTASGKQVTPRPMQFGPVGGPHSVKLTRAGFQPLVDHVTRGVVGE